MSYRYFVVIAGSALRSKTAAEQKKSFRYNFQRYFSGNSYGTKVGAAGSGSTGAVEQAFVKQLAAPELHPGFSGALSYGSLGLLPDVVAAMFDDCSRPKKPVRYNFQKYFSNN